MKKNLLVALLLVFTAAVGQPRRVTNMDAGWRFHQGDVMGAEAATYNDMDWRRLDVPHDWSIEGDNLRENPGGGSIDCEEVELFVNGKSYGKKATEFPRRGVNPSWASYDPGKHFATTADLHLTWDVEYQPGEIKVVGKRDGQTFEDVIRTASVPAQLRATVDRPSFRAIPSDVAHVTIEVLDKDGSLCPLADNQVRFSVKGGRLIGVESGNMTDLSSVLASERKAWSGKCLAIIAADRPGPVTVTAQSDGMPASTVTFMATK